MERKSTYFKADHRVVDASEILSRAHQVRLFDGTTFINHQNGLFFSTNGNEKMPLDKIYPLIRTCYLTNRLIFARRRRYNAQLLAGHIVKK